MFDAIDSLSERTAWDILFGKSILTVIKDNFDLLKEYRNDVMHAHNINYDRFKAIKNLFFDVNLELEKQIDEILQYPSGTLIPLAAVDILYDKFVEFSNGAEIIVNNLSKFIDLFATLSTNSIPQENLINLEKLAKLIGTPTELVKDKIFSQRDDSDIKETSKNMSASKDEGDEHL